MTVASRLAITRKKNKGELGALVSGSTGGGRRRGLGTCKFRIKAKIGKKGHVTLELL